MSVFTDIERKFHELEIRPSTTAKLELLKEYLQDQDFLWVVDACLNPYKTCGLSGYVGMDDPEAETVTMGALRDTVLQLQQRVLTGYAAADAIRNLAMGGVPATLLDRIFSKNLRCGVADTLVNKARPNTVPTFKVALAEPYKDCAEKLVFPAFSSPKFDGLRCIVIVGGAGNAQFLSRNGLPFPALSEFSDAFKALGKFNVVYDCEVINGDFYKGSGKVRQKTKKASESMFMVFDYMTLKEFTERKSEHPQWVRLNMLAEVLRDQKINDPIQYCPHEIVYNDEQVQAANKSYWARGLEGSIIKQYDAPYEFKRSINWAKIKQSLSFDVPITGMVEGKGKYVGMMGALEVDYLGVKTNVGTGFSDQQRREFWDNRESMVGQIAEIVCHEETPDKSLRHGVFVRLRPDKRVEDGVGS